MEEGAAGEEGQGGRHAQSGWIWWRVPVRAALLCLAVADTPAPKNGCPPPEVVGVCYCARNRCPRQMCDMWQMCVADIALNTNLACCLGQEKLFFEKKFFLPILVWYPDPHHIIL